jgi:hypothetical protein
VLTQDGKPPVPTFPLVLDERAAKILAVAVATLRRWTQAGFNQQAGPIVPLAVHFVVEQQIIQ